MFFQLKKVLDFSEKLCYNSDQRKKPGDRRENLKKERARKGE